MAKRELAELLQEWRQHGPSLDDGPGSKLGNVCKTQQQKSAPDCPVLLVLQTLQSLMFLQSRDLLKHD